MRPETRRPKIVATLRKLDSDVFLLQEVQADEFRLLKDALPEYEGFARWHGPQHWNPRGKPIPRNGNAIFVRRGFLTKISIHRAQLGKSGNVATVLRGEHKGVPMVLVSIHLDDSAKKRRLAQLAALDAYFRRHGDLDKSVILGGDFNDPQAPEWIPPSWSGRHDKPTYLEDHSQAIDFVFSNKLAAKRITVPVSDSCLIVRDWGSDHLPVTVTLA